MAVLANKQWTGELIQMKLYIDTDEVYTTDSLGVYDSSGTLTSLIESVSFSKSDGNTNVNPLGVASSDSIGLKIFDINDALSPANLNGPYAGKLTNGLKVEINKSSDGGQTWNPYGVYYTNNFSGSYSDGYHDLVSISASDRLNILGNTPVPELPVYANVTIKELIVALFTALGYSKDEYYIDPKLNFNILWGVLPGTKVRDFFNSVCQRTFARVTVNSTGVVRFIPALQLATEYNTLTVGPTDIGTLKNSNSNNINYSKVNVKYDVYGTTADATVLSRDGVSLALGHNEISDIQFSNTVVCIKNVYIRYKSELSLAKIENVEYQAYQRAMVLSLDVLNANAFEVSIRVDAVVLTTIEKTASVSLDTGIRSGLTEYTLDTNNQMTDEEAQQLCNDIVDYIKTLENTIEISGTILTPDLSIGDEITIENTGTMYDGVYKVTKLQVEFGQSYSLGATLLRVESSDNEGDSSDNEEDSTEDGTVE